jgi:hypothetical protein
MVRAEVHCALFRAEVHCAHGQGGRELRAWSGRSCTSRMVGADVNCVHGWSGCELRAWLERT